MFSCSLLVFLFADRLHVARARCAGLNDKWPDCGVRIANFVSVGQDYCKQNADCQKTCCEIAHPTITTPPPPVGPAICDKTLCAERFELLRSWDYTENQARHRITWWDDANQREDLVTCGLCEVPPDDTVDAQLANHVRSWVQASEELVFDVETQQKLTTLFHRTISPSEFIKAQRGTSSLDPEGACKGQLMSAGCSGMMVHAYGHGALPMKSLQPARCPEQDDFDLETKRLKPEKTGDHSVSFCMDQGSASLLRASTSYTFLRRDIETHWFGDAYPTYGGVKSGVVLEPNKLDYYYLCAYAVDAGSDSFNECGCRVQQPRADPTHLGQQSKNCPLPPVNRTWSPWLCREGMELGDYASLGHMIPGNDAVFPNAVLDGERRHVMRLAETRCAIGGGAQFDSLFADALRKANFRLTDGSVETEVVIKSFFGEDFVDLPILAFFWSVENAAPQAEFEWYVGQAKLLHDITGGKKHVPVCAIDRAAIVSQSLSSTPFKYCVKYKPAEKASASAVLAQRSSSLGNVSSTAVAATALLSGMALAIALGLWRTGSRSVGVASQPLLD